MADEFVSIPISTDPDTLFQEAVERMQQIWPDWRPEPGNPETVMFLAWAFMFSELAALAASMPERAFQQAGQTLFSLPPQEATQAQGVSTWKAIDNKGHEIKAGTQITVEVTGDRFVGFEVLNTVIIDPGETETAAGEVQIRAVESGTEGNEIGGVADPVEALDWIDEIVLVGETSGGEDAETTEEYSNRLRKELRLLGPRPIIPIDFEIRALNHPAVARSLAIDGWDPETETDENERMIALATIDAAGLGSVAKVKEEIDADLQSKREVNFIVNMIDPTYTKVNVSLEAQPIPGFSKEQVKLALEEALDSYFDPAKWGLPTFGDPSLGGGWRKLDKVRLNDVVAVAEAVLSVDFTKNVKISKGVAEPKAEDVVLDGAAPLTEVGVLTVTVI